MKCKFCGCSDERPCRIPVDIDGQITNAAPGSYKVAYAACGWLIENICTSPPCVEKAYAEAELLASQMQFLLDRDRIA